MNKIHVWYRPLSGHYVAGRARPHPTLPGVMEATGDVTDVTSDVERIIREANTRERRERAERRAARIAASNKARSDYALTHIEPDP